MKVPHFFTSTTIAIALLLTSSLNVFPETLVNAKQPSSVKRSSPVAIRYVPPKPPAKGTPGNAGRGAASRSCLGVVQASEQKLLNTLNALVPEYKVGKTTSVWGITFVERPTFWFYVPYRSSGMASLEFVLRDDEERTLQRIPVAIPQTPGMIQVTLPDDQPGLEVDKTYNWFFAVRGKCAQEVVVFVEGWITRASADSNLAQQLQQAKPREKAALLAEAGIWYDALNGLAELRRADPKNAEVNSDWNTLLQDSGMGDLVAEPFVQVAESR